MDNKQFKLLIDILRYGFSFVLLYLGTMGFTYLKITDKVNWSWWFILIPLLLPFFIINGPAVSYQSELEKEILYAKKKLEEEKK